MAKYCIDGVLPQKKLLVIIFFAEVLRSSEINQGVSGSVATSKMCQISRNQIKVWSVYRSK